MYVLTNAFKNLGRNKGRNLLMGVIILALITTAIISMIINNTSNGIIDDYAKRFGAEVTISPDQNKAVDYIQQGKNLPEITTDQYLDFGKSDYIQKASYDASLPSISDKLKAVDEDKNSNQSGFSMPQMDNPDAKTPKLQLKGSSSKDDLEEFKKKKRKLVKGQFFKNKNEVIISEELAKVNGLNVGDTFTLNSASYPNAGNYELKVSGIYEDNTDEYDGLPIQLPMLNKRNEILTSFDTVVDNNYAKEHPVSIDAKYSLKDPKKLDAFTKEVRSKGLNDIYEVTADTANYDKVVGPVKRLKDITFTFMIIVLLLGAVTLILLSTLAMRERKYEIGVLRAMGMKKQKVALGLIAEMVIITTVCLGLGFGIGSASAQKISNQLLKNQVEIAEKKSNQQDGGQMVAQTSQLSESEVKPLTEMKIGIDSKTVVEIIGISLLLVLLTSVIGTVYITKYEPIKILSERN